MVGQYQEPARVVVAGVGAVTSQGPTADALWEGVKAGRVAIRPVQRLPMDGYMTRIGGEVQDEVEPTHEYRHPSGFRERVIDFALKASDEAFKSANISLEQVPGERWGVVIGTCNTGMLSGQEWYARTLAGQSPDPEMVLLVPPQAIAEAISAAFGLKGPVLSVDTACAASANAIGYAAELIRSGQVDAVLTGGTDALSDVLFAGFNCLESLSPEPAAPYSKDRQGLSLGEGSGMLVLCREDVAERAGAMALAEVLGYSLSADGFHPTAPHPEGKGAARAIKAALDAAGVEPSEVRYVNSHGTGTPKNDPAETKATKLALGDAAKNVAVSSTKSMIGHLLGAAGAVECIVTVKALQHQVAPPTANYKESDPECDLDYVPNVARSLAMDVALSNNFAFGGANASLVLGRGGLKRTPAPPRVDKVVITGLSTLTSASCDAEEVWSAFVAGRDCTADENGVRIGRVELDPSPFLSPRERRRMDRLGIFSVVASAMALKDAGLELTDENRERVGVILGTGVGPMESLERFTRPVIEEGAAGANPAVFPNTVYNAAVGQVAMALGTLGPASAVTAGHAAGGSAIAYCYDLLVSNQADAMVALAADTLTDTVIGGYRNLGVLAKSGDDDSTSGYALSEAGIALVLERESSAKARGATILGEVLGHAVTSDAKGVGRYDPEGEGLERAMRLALERAGLEPSDIGAIWTGLDGHAGIDAAERAAINRVFGDGALDGSSGPRLYAPKLLFGEPVGAGASLNAVLALKAWQHGHADLPRGKPALINSCSLGGTNFSIVLGAR
ncbi:MAG: beta-ketoacyl-[acyl-carrier-protein] synthase family protein [Chloroflexota bacterium]